MCVVAQVWCGVGETRRFERQRQMPYGRWYSQQKETPLGSVDIWQYIRDQQWHSHVLMPSYTACQWSHVPAMLKHTWGGVICLRMCSALHCLVHTEDVLFWSCEVWTETFNVSVAVMGLIPARKETQQYIISMLFKAQRHVWFIEFIAV